MAAQCPMLAVDANAIAQPWPELPAQMKRFFELTFLVVRRDETQVTEYWCPDEAVKQFLAGRARGVKIGQHSSCDRN